MNWTARLTRNLDESKAVPKVASIKVDAFQNMKPEGFCIVGSRPPAADGYFWDSHGRGRDVDLLVSSFSDVSILMDAF